MMISIRPFQNYNHEFVLGLNKKNSEALIPMDEKGLRFLCDKAELFDIAYVDGVPAGFLIALREGIKEYDYRSYKWFCENYAKFLYIDQVVIDAKFRNQGIGISLYQNAFKHANRTGVEIVAAATTADNEASLGLHAKMGFNKVGEQLIRGGTTRIIQQIKDVSNMDY